MESTKTKLEKACLGVMMMSETDYPFEYFSLAEDDHNENNIFIYSNRLNGPVEIISLEYLFRNMMKVYSDSSDEEEESAERFQNLMNVLNAELRSVKVYRIGIMKVEVYIAGISLEGVVEGLKTRLIET
ncbi:nuclease A inhibitor family protein [Paradesertivirga mongoliensis]|uniref:Nuclease A inhibitor family protein n=1 Tax=Paradesertivirga mongoliensis TaxID=2100740 RepID=A0ABW4ZFT5_9SPHI|nr:nuclease A inhibitor family protein [Pedobacter mongoliensis]